ncbi:O-antigen/teichoic acid export membrane protein [Nocardioides ginsengisegetis]|uniref:O-antigen/teichoic acid export membrane protein n=2 Tax=Nocardioides ginsengisegetis TaxID=661491 RepID=A0A7W3P9W6_9ACTN|nr:O-antigen/teichoic acid export membrane protein [Nocardioides ginsengisegetis]
MSTMTGEAPSRLRGLLRGSAGIAVAMAVMNVATYGFQMVAARLMGPSNYGAIAGLMALLMVIAVLQLGLQATAARRISATPGHVAQIEQVILAVTYKAAFVLGGVMLLVSPAVWVLLRLDSIVPAILLAVAAVPLTIMGGQAGILQGERRWLPLAGVYMAVGVPRLLIGTAFILWRPSETSAMFGVMVGLFVPAVIGWWALRHGRDEGETSEDHLARPIVRETLISSQALLAFFVLSNLDIVVARNILDDHNAGLYAGGLILTKAVLFLPQFVVVVAFPSMSTVEERRRALVRSLAAVAVIGVVCTLGAWLLSGIAMVFVGGDGYLDIESDLWRFAVIGTLLSMLQLLVYSVLARQGTRSAYVVWLAVLGLVGASAWIHSLTGLILAVTVVDGALFVLLLALSLWRMRLPAPAAPAAPPV